MIGFKAKLSDSAGIENKNDFILSIGGGTPCYANNHLYLQNEDVISIYLKATIQSLANRLKNKRENRPILKNLSENELEEFIAKHLFDRSFYYHQAKHIISVDDKSKKEIVTEIMQLI